MRKQSSPWTLAGTAAVTLALLASQLSAQENPPVNLEAKEVVIQLVTDDGPGGGEIAIANLEVAASEFWIGVSLEPLNDLLKAQLNLDHGLVVNTIYPDSPAEKAAFKVHDIVIKAGDTVVKDASDLVKAVDAAKESELTVTVVRGGKEMPIKVNPAKRGPRPAQTLRFEAAPGVPGADHRKAMELYHQHMQKAMEALKATGADGKPMDLLFFRPGIVGGEDQVRVESRVEHALPQDVSIQVSKQGDQPAKITVKRDGKTWEVSEGKLDELPADLRPHVAGMLHAPGELRLHAFAPGAPLGRGQWLPAPAPNAAAVPGVRAVPVVPAVPHRPSRVIIEKSDANPSTTAADKQLVELLDEVRQLRKEVQEMKAGKGPK